MSVTDRDLVLAYPDLAKQLTELPLRFSQPEAWNGYIPPDTFNGQYNDSPRRAALLALVAEARRRRDEEHRQVAQ